MTPADIRRLVPAAFEFLWRTILNREHGTSYRHVDANGIDCLTEDTAYQIYHHQGASWPVVQGKFRDDVHAAQRARAKGLFRFDEFVFITTFGFQEPAHRAWLEGRKFRALPLRVMAWGEEHLCDQLARHPDLAAQFGLGPFSPGVGGHGGALGHILELQAAAVTMLQRLLAAPGETLPLADLRVQTGLVDPKTESDFKLLLYSLTTRGFIHVIDPRFHAAPPAESLLLFPSVSGTSVGPVTVTLLPAGKDYLVREAEWLATNVSDPKACREAE